MLPKYRTGLGRCATRARWQVNRVNARRWAGCGSFRRLRGGWICLGRLPRPPPGAIFEPSLREGAPRPVRTHEKRTAGAEAHVDFAALAARLKSCPVTKLSRIPCEMNFSATCEAQIHFAPFNVRTEARTVQTGPLARPV